MGIVKFFSLVIMLDWGSVNSQQFPLELDVR